MMTYFCIAVGGALGSVSRFAAQGVVQRVAGDSFPAGTLAVNVLGCLLIGMAAGAFASPAILVRPEYRLGLTAGFLGGFTTFSTFGLETMNLAADREWRLAAANVALSCGLGFFAVWCGSRLAQWWWGA
jgi:CrcB protein